MTAAALLLAYGGLLLFCGCSTLLITATSANRQNQNIFGQAPAAIQSRVILDFASGIAQFLVSAVMIVSGIAAFRRYPAGLWCGLSSLAAQLVIMIISTILAFLIVNLQQKQAFFPGVGAMAIVLVVQFFPYVIWLAFAVPIGVLLNAPSARAAFANRPFFGFEIPGRGGEETDKQ
jgi:hypothetical protein